MALAAVTCFLAAGAAIPASATAGLPQAGSYFAIYDGVKSVPAEECALHQVGRKVPDSCCESSSVSIHEGINDLFEAPAQCRLLANQDGSAIRAFFGCVGNTITYAEVCYDSRVPDYPFPFPPGVNATELTKSVATPEECGCTSLVGSGPGCFKANDLSTQGHNKYKNDKQHFYVMLKPCSEASESVLASSPSFPFLTGFSAFALVLFMGSMALIRLKLRRSSATDNEYARFVDGTGESTSA